MYDTICTLPLSSDLFTQATHPSSPLLAVGLAGGHVQTFRLPPIASDSGAENGFGTIETVWRTRRHKGSCRSLAWSADGEALHSAGTDALLKTASTSTGQVTSKILLPLTQSASSTTTSRTHDLPTQLYALSPQTLLVASESGHLYTYDLRTSNQPSSRPSQKYTPHEDYIASLCPLPSKASQLPKQIVTVGGSTLAITDVRKGVITQSEDQDEELLSCLLVRGQQGNEEVGVGTSNGILTLWPRGTWTDQQERIIVDSGRGGGESVDCMTILAPNSTQGSSEEGNIAIGTGNGLVKFIDVARRKVVDSVRHDEIESVLGLSVDIGGRLISGGGAVVKVWRESILEDEDAASDEDVGGLNGRGKRMIAHNSDSDDAGKSKSSEDSEVEVRKKKRRKRRKKGRLNGGGGSSGGGKGVLAFKGMD